VKTAERVALGVIILVYLALAVGYSLANPLYESTDELRHVRYVRHIATYGNLPVQRSGVPRAQSHHPPLYYALGALISCWVPVELDVYYQPPENPFWAYRYWEVGNDNKNQYVHSADERFPFRGITLAIYLVRWMTVLIGAGVVWLTYRIGREAFRDQPALALGGAALVAFNPQFLYLSGAVNNDVPAALWGAAVLLVCIQILEESPKVRTHVTLGVFIGLALLTKIHLVVLLVPIELAYGWRVWRERDWRGLLRVNLIILGVAALISGWWFGRNQVLYGDPLGVSAHGALWNSRSPSQGWWAIQRELPYLWSSLWGRFGYGQVAMPQVVYQGLLVLSLFAAAAFLFPRRRAFSPATWAVLGTTVLAFVAWVLYYTSVQPAGARGRFVFPALPAIAVLMIGGPSGLFPRRLSWITGGTVAVLMVSLALYALLGVLAPAFASPRALSLTEIEGIPRLEDYRSVVDFEDKARLLGFHVSPQDIDPADKVEVTLYWQALARTEKNLVVFVHILSDAGTMIAQRDTYPGLGRYPTTVWDPGVVFADTYRVHVPEFAYAPDKGTIQVGLYYPEGPRLRTDDGRDAVRLARISIRPRPGDIPNPVHVNFDDKLALVGYALDQRAARPGDTVRLTLYWRALNPMTLNYRLFVHVMGKENQIWANSDSPLTDRAVCTNRWEPGILVQEVRELTIGEGTPPGFYDIELGLRASGHGRLEILAEDGRHIGNQLTLTTIRVLGHD
jgi:4-amino-4-deoxy-L-arabinose transferase-like glycosyltransferase